ncbi:hypothetical protein DL96DRAFT_1595548 [Flagelloscypha sp. PMI_526]|nr:hypothetical protein DL96DRAFT_1595548 [Flagelloscypha sp. PMI_526]
MPFVLILVAKHVQRWVEPLIYRHIDLYNKTAAVIPNILAVSKARGPDFLANAVRSMPFENRTHRKIAAENVIELVGACPKVKYMCICGGLFYSKEERPDLQESIVKLGSVTHVALPRAICFESLMSMRVRLDKPTSWNLTHLDLGSGSFPPIELLDVTTLPRLTHLAFGPDLDGFELSGPHSTSAIHNFLDSRRHQLHCVWFCGWAWQNTEFMVFQDKEKYRHFLVVQLDCPSPNEWMDNCNEMVEGIGSLWAPAIAVLQIRAQGAKGGEFLSHGRSVQRGDL